MLSFSLSADLWINKDTYSPMIVRTFDEALTEKGAKCGARKDRGREVRLVWRDENQATH